MAEPADVPAPIALSRRVAKPARPTTDIFERTDRWDVPFDERHQRRLALTLGLIPRDVESVLDVGCGRGDILNHLPPGLFRVGCDLSVKGLERVRAHRVRSSSNLLPIAARSVDLALCCEVLEHVVADDLAPTVAELARVARKYVLITVPYREDLDQLISRCPRCREQFHPYGHLRSFDEASLADLHESLEMIDFRTLCWEERRTRSWVRHIRREWLGVFNVFPHMACPACGNLSFRSSAAATLLRYVTGALNVMSCPGTRKEGWVGALYRVRV